MCSGAKGHVCVHSQVSKSVRVYVYLCGKMLASNDQREVKGICTILQLFCKFEMISK